jgi:hypothetical protein
MDLRPKWGILVFSAVAHSLISSPTVVMPTGAILEKAGSIMTDVRVERPEPPEPDQAPETPPDEPQPVPVQDPPAEPNPSPYVVSTDHPGQQERE